MKCSFSMLLTAVLFSGIAGLLSGLLSSSAQASAGNLTPAGPTTGAIHVVSEDNQSWTKVKAGTIGFPVILESHAPKLVPLNRVWVVQGNLLDVTFHSIYDSGLITGQTDHYYTGTLPGGTLHVGQTERDQIVALCNAKLNPFSNEQPQQEDEVQIPLTLVKQTTTGGGSISEGIVLEEQTLTKQFPVKVICDPFTKDLPGAVATDQGKFLIKESKLFLTTIITGQNAGHTLGGCKTLKTSVRFETNKLGPVTFELNRFPGGKTTHTVDAEFEPETGKYYARYEKYEAFQTTTSVQYMAKSTSPSAGNTGWKDITIYCGGGFSQNPNTSNPDNSILPQGKTLTGNFTFVDYGSPKCDRKGKALIGFKSPKADNIHYSLDCTNGHFSGVAQTAPSPDGGYAAVALVSFDITETTQSTCTLNTVAPYQPKSHMTKDHLFQCVKSIVDTGSNDIQVAPKPNTGNTRAPATSIPNALEKAAANSTKRRREAAAKVAEAKRKREAAKKAAEARRKREAAAKKAAAAARRESAKKAAEARRKRAEAAKKAAEATRKREAAAKKAVEARRKAAEAAKKAAEALRKGRAAAKRRTSMR